MSFGPSSMEKTASTQQQKIGDTAVANAGVATGKGADLLNTGGSNVNAATNFFKPLVSGNQAETTAALQPDIDRIRAAGQGSLQMASTLMPRGGGRSAALFNASTAPTGQIQNLFNSARPAAADAMAKIGLQQTGQGTNLFNTGNAFLQTGGTADSNLMDYGMKQRQIQYDQWGKIGKSLFSLATTPFGGAAPAGSLFSKFGG